MIPENLVGTTFPSFSDKFIFRRRLHPFLEILADDLGPAFHKILSCEGRGFRKSPQTLCVSFSLVFLPTANISIVTRELPSCPA